MNTFTPDTPHHMLSDYTEERCHELGLPCARDDNGLTVTVSAKDDGLPDWETFLRVAHELQGADGWVMEGAKAWHNVAWCARSGFNRIRGEHTPDEIPDDIFNCLKDDNSNLVRRLIDMAIYDTDNAVCPLADLSRACVAYSRSGVTV